MSPNTRKQIEAMNAGGVHSCPIEVGTPGSLGHGFVERRYFLTRDGLKVTYSMVRALLPKNCPAAVPLREALAATGLLEDFEAGWTVSLAPTTV